MTWIFFLLTCTIHIGLAQNAWYIRSIPTTPQNFKNYFEIKCEKNGHPEVYQNIQNIFETFNSCMASIDNSEWIEMRMPTFMNIDADKVSKTACKILKISDKCLKEMTEHLEPCFSYKEQKTLEISFEVFKNLNEYICNDNGAKITEFITEGGLQCISNKKHAMQTCLVHETQGQQNNPTMYDIVHEEFTITEEDCNKWSGLQTCVVNEIKTCNKPPLTTIVDSLFNVVRDATTCNDANSAISFAVTTLIVLMALIATILV